MKLTVKKLYELIKESLNPNHREKLIMLLLSSVEDATLAFDLMDRLDLDDTEQMNIINDAMLRDPEMARNMTGIGQISELHTILKRKINEILMKDLEGFDLGDFNERQ